MIMATKAAKPKKPKASKPKAPKAKQGYLDPDMAPPSIPELDDLIEPYIDSVRSRKEATDRQMELADQIDAVMKSHNLTAYEYENKIVGRTLSERISVKNKKQEKQDDGE